ncbi:MAG TPA: hypothetical protein DCY07_05680 [Rhodospirillaceae bacterium]|nr:hypothetical protein [Rhodospirillaceae bacterium]
MTVLSLCFFLFSCTNTFPPDKIDPAGNMTRDDYLELRQRGEPKETNSPDANTPPAVPALPVSLGPELPAPFPLTSVPRSPSGGDHGAALPSKKISVTITDTVPLRDILIELGREGEVNLEIDPRIEGSIIFTAHQQPFDTVLRRICDLAGLRYKREGAFVRIEVDEPYQHSYALDHLSLSRRSTSEVTIATNVFDMDVAGSNGSSAGSGGKSDNDNNSTSKIAGVTDADFWSEVEKSLPHVLATVSKTRPLTTGRTGDNKQDANFSIDRQAGLITVYGNSRQQEAVANYLTRLDQKASSQVLIEARIVEVELNDEFKSGVNWSTLFKGATGLAANFGAGGTATTAASNGLFTASLDSKDFNGILSLVRTFGATRVLSSPRLTVMNNQTAVLKVAKNEVYFLTSAQFPTTTTASGIVVSGTPVFTSMPRTVPVGLVMTVQPAINNDTNRVTMTLRPTISRVTNYVNDPSIGLNAANAGVSNPIQSQIPVLAVREMDSVLQMQSGEVAVMGGLMQDSSENQDQGVPPFDAMPVVGNLAKSRDNQGATSELVILLRATIMNNARPHDADTDLYKKYNNDPRPLPLPNTMKGT